MRFQQRTRSTYRNIVPSLSAPTTTVSIGRYMIKLSLMYTGGKSSSPCRLIELRNGLRCMLVTNNLHEDRDNDDDDDDDEERSDQDKTELVIDMPTHRSFATWCSSVFLATSRPLPMWMKHSHSISWFENFDHAYLREDSHLYFRRRSLCTFRSVLYSILPRRKDLLI